MAAKYEYRHPTNFKLAEDEEFVLCPYEISHQVTNNRLLVHLTKCRRNFIQKCERGGEAVPMLACKYNWCHHVPQPEILIHEKTCTDRHAIISHVLEYLEPDSRMPDIFYRRTEKYVTRGVARKLPTAPKAFPEAVQVADSVVSAHVANGPVIKTFPKAPSSVTSVSTTSVDSEKIGRGSGLRREYFSKPKMKMRSATKAAEITIKTTYYSASEMSMSESADSELWTDGDAKTITDSNSDYTHADEEGENSSSSVSTIGKKRTPKNATTASEVKQNATDEDKANEDWEVASFLSPYDPLRKFETDTLLKYPPGLSKSERKKWREENVEKVKRLYGGTLHSLAASSQPPDQPRT